MREHRGRYLVAPLALVLVTGLLYHSLGVAYTSYILLYYFSWPTYHYMRQNYARSLPLSRPRPTRCDCTGWRK